MLKKWPIGEIITIAAIVIVILLTLRLASDNKKLSVDNGKLSEQIKDVGQKNEGLANSIDGLVEQIGVMNKIVATEARRRAAAEMKAQKLQEEVKDALKGNACAVEYIPANAVIGVRKAADSARGHKGKKSADTRKSTD
ncbi:DUF2570 domain-containing protein [Enterobacter asburiae]|uniref:DUF2570 domain-containing protein n=1 Tax=Enterobacter asburiae TaxID=61645 RepID=UPI001E2D650C|nr:DUF2570 domain-containing protein [Enterobacter asburiae]MCE2000798.1 DUF2570 domain-containing protein [Enterobacter asburiae]MDW3573883.1 DUF2570 domain-containing protein [Enterobacter asburiae]HCR1905267.1 DUF2570 domain-containing protein [Enterobacter asburiae]